MVDQLALLVFAEQLVDLARKDRGFYY